MIVDSISGVELASSVTPVTNYLGGPIALGLAVNNSREVAVQFDNPVIDSGDYTATGTVIYNCRLAAAMTIISHSGDSTATLTYSLQEDILPGDVIQFIQYSITDTCP